MFKNLKSLFIVEDTEAEKKEENISTDDIYEEEESDIIMEEDFEEEESIDDFEFDATGTTLVNTSEIDEEVLASEGKVDPKIIEKLLQEVEKNNMEGFDYFEFKKSLKALEQMPMDEATKYRSAFATASTMGVTLDKLLSSAKFYVGILDGENKKFTTVFESQISDNVDGKEEEIVQLEATIKEKAAQIKLLTEQIAEHQEQIGKLAQKIKDSKVKISETQNNFMVSFNFLKAQFDEDISKMQQYLK